MKRCSAPAYYLKKLSDLLGLVAMVTLFVLVSALLRHSMYGTFRPRMLFILIIPFLMAAGARIMLELSWKIVARKSFRYDYERDVVSWIEDGRSLHFRAGYAGGEPEILVTDDGSGHED